MPSFPSKIAIYRRETQNVDVATAREIAAQLVEDVAPLKSMRTMYVTRGSLNGNPYRVEVDRIPGAVVLSNERFYERDSPIRKTGAFPSPDEAAAMAEGFLERHGLMPKDRSSVYLRGVSDNRSGADVLTVAFGRRIDGIDSWGSGSRIYVDIGRNGSVARVSKAWPELKPVGEYQIIPPAAAIEKLRRGEGTSYGGRSGRVVEVKIVYYDTRSSTEYVQPCYYVECADEGSGQRFHAVVGAIGPEHLRGR